MGVWVYVDVPCMFVCARCWWQCMRGRVQAEGAQGTLQQLLPPAAQHPCRFLPLSHPHQRTHTPTHQHTHPTHTPTHQHPHTHTQGQHERSVEWFRRALRLCRTYLSAWTLMGHEFVEMKNAPAAIGGWVGRGWLGGGLGG